MNYSANGGRGLLSKILRKPPPRLAERVAQRRRRRPVGCEIDASKREGGAGCLEAEGGTRRSRRGLQH